MPSFVIDQGMIHFRDEIKFGFAFGEPAREFKVKLEFGIFVQACSDNYDAIPNERLKVSWNAVDAIIISVRF